MSDTLLYMPTRRDDAQRLRLRAAGGEELSLQKQESLGGWSALRGYAFKEFRGDAPVLASAEHPGSPRAGVMSACVAAAAP